MTELIVILIIAGIIIFLLTRRKRETTPIQTETEAQFDTKQPQKYAMSIFDEDKDKALIQLAGIRHHKTTSDLDFNPNEQVYLVPEPNNHQDRNAVKVINNKGIKIGYIPKLYNIEILDLIKEGYYFIVMVYSINLNEIDYPSALLEITKTKEPTLISLTQEEITVLSNTGVKIEEEYKKDSRISFELSQKGRELEDANNVTEAIKYFEEAILLPNTPPIAFMRLAIYYRRIKDYSSEIRILNKNIEYVINSRMLDDLKNDEIEKIKYRIEKAKILNDKTKK